MNTILKVEHLGKRYGKFWALKDCSFNLEQGQVTALVGPNGAGKSTLMEIAVGLIAPTKGTVEIMGDSPTSDSAKVLPHVGFMAQEHPLYRGFNLEEILSFGRRTNPRWDDSWARERISQVGLPLKKKVGQLSGGQQAQIALLLALAKRPDLLLLDEPIAGFDPLARREFLQLLMETVAETGVSVLLSSHILGDLERVCDSIIILREGNIQLYGEIEQIMEFHRVVIGPLGEEMLASSVHTIVDRTRTEKQVATLVKLDAPLVLSDLWSVYEPNLEEIVIGYLQRRNGSALSSKERIAI